MANNTDVLYYRARKYNRTLTSKLTVLAYVYFQYNGDIKKLPNEMFKSVSKEEFVMWFNKIKDMTLKDYLDIPNIEERRILLSEYLNTEKGKQEIINASTLISTETLNKKTWWYDKNAEKEVEYQDVYSLYLVELNKLFIGDNPSIRNIKDSFGYLLMFKDTSTSRQYMLWVDIEDILSINCKDKIVEQYNKIFENISSVEEAKKQLIEFLPKHIGAVDAIAWTITTTVPKDKIRKIIRQGDCILVDADIKSRKELVEDYHLTRELYLEKMYKES